jgi:hypothetical protein
MATYRLDASSSLISLDTLGSDASHARRSTLDDTVRPSEGLRSTSVLSEMNDHASSPSDAEHHPEPILVDDTDTAGLVNPYADGGYGWVVTAG